MIMKRINLIFAAAFILSLIAGCGVAPQHSLESHVASVGATPVKETGKLYGRQGGVGFSTGYYLKTDKKTIHVDLATNGFVSSFKSGITAEIEGFYKNVKALNGDATMLVATKVSAQGDDGQTLFPAITVAGQIYKSGGGIGFSTGYYLRGEGNKTYHIDLTTNRLTDKFARGAKVTVSGFLAKRDALNGEVEVVVAETMLGEDAVDLNPKVTKVGTLRRASSGGIGFSSGYVLDTTEGRIHVDLSANNLPDDFKNGVKASVTGHMITHRALNGDVEILVADAWTEAN